jgi:hypothetical protein
MSESRRFQARAAALASAWEDFLFPALKFLLPSEKRGARLAFALSGALLLAGPSARGTQDESVRDTAELESELRSRGMAFSAELGEPSPSLEKARDLAESLLEKSRTLAERYRRQCSLMVPELKEWLADRTEAPLQELREAPVVLFGSATEAEVLGSWRRQLGDCGAAVRGLLDQTPGVVRDWLYWQDREGRRKAGQPFFTAEQIRDCARESLKLISLLRLPKRVIRLRAGRRLAGGDAPEASDFKSFGSGEISWQDGALKIAGEGVSVWWMKEFSDAVLSFDFTPVKGRGGVLFAFPALPLASKGLEDSAGAMERYNRGLDAYHVSLCRGDSGVSNLRRTGPGLKMLSSVRPDPCASLGRTYRVEILSYHESHEVYVEGTLLHAYVDAGCYAVPLTRGRFGIRHFSGEPLECLYGKFRAEALE